MFYLDDNEINDILTMIGRNIGQVYDLSDGFTERLNGITKSGLYGNGVEVINTQIDSVREGLEAFRKITNESIANIANYELDLSKKAENIYIPSGFDSWDSSILETFNEFSYNKSDGRSVTETNASRQSIYDGEYKNVDAKTISKLKVNATTTKEISDYTNIKEKESITKLKEEKLKENILNDYKETNKKILRNTNKGNTDINNINLIDEININESKIYAPPKNDIDLEDIDFGEEL
ncbi:MAG: hypothetical protein IJ568_03890 [Bacilli bacterium]|nr:hypothetical protein [Bacilli bacterium]